MNSYLSALSRAIGIRRFVIGSTVIVVISLYGYARSWAVDHGLSFLPGLPAWLLALLVAFVLVGWWLLGRIVDLEREIDPRIEMLSGNGPPFEITEPMGSIGPAIRLCRVQVRNKSVKNLENCIVKLENIRHLDRSPFANRFTPVGLMTQHQLLQKRQGGPFDLRAGERKIVEVAFLDESNAQSEIGLWYETPSYPNLIPRGEYELTLKAYGGGAPVEKRFKLFIQQGRLRLDEASTSEGV